MQHYPSYTNKWNFASITTPHNKISPEIATQKPDIPQLQIIDDGPPSGSSNILSQQGNLELDKVIKRDCVSVFYNLCMLAM